MATGTSGIPVVTVRGALGNVVFQRHGDGLMVRERVVPHDPKTAAQLAARAAMDRAAALWRALTDAQFDAWTRYAEAQGESAYRVYLGLTTKWLRVHPGGSPPSLPPSGPFFGDNLQFTISAFGLSVGEGPSESDDFLLSNLPITASQPNAAGVVTEILVQKLPHARRKPRDRDWKTGAFLTFTASTLTQTVPLPAGAYAVAYKFVNAATGQATGMATLGSIALGEEPV